MDAEQLISYFNRRIDDDALVQLVSSDAPLKIDGEEAITVVPGHLIRICDAVLDGKIESTAIERIGSAIICSDLFGYDLDTDDGDRVAHVAMCWENPYGNYMLNRETIEKFKLLLQTGDNQFTDQDHYLDRHGRPRK